jgi:hypothetical protein
VASPSGLISSLINQSNMHADRQSALPPKRPLGGIRRLAGHQTPQVADRQLSSDTAAASDPQSSERSSGGSEGLALGRFASPTEGGKPLDTPGASRSSDAKSEGPIEALSGSELAGELVPMDVLPMADPALLADANQPDVLQGFPPPMSSPAPPPPIEDTTFSTMRRPGGGRR